MDKARTIKVGDVISCEAFQWGIKEPKWKSVSLTSGYQDNKTYVRKEEKVIIDGKEFIREYDELKDYSANDPTRNDALFIVTKVDYHQYNDRSDHWTQKYIIANRLDGVKEQIEFCPDDFKNIKFHDENISEQQARELARSVLKPLMPKHLINLILGEENAPTA